MIRAIGVAAPVLLFGVLLAWRRGVAGGRAMPVLLAAGAGVALVVALPPAAAWLAPLNAAWARAHPFTTALLYAALPEEAAKLAILLAVHRICGAAAGGPIPGRAALLLLSAAATGIALAENAMALSRPAAGLPLLAERALAGSIAHLGLAAILAQGWAQGWAGRLRPLMALALAILVHAAYDAAYLAGLRPAVILFWCGFAAATAWAWARAKT